MVIFPNAKINLGLRVVEKRPDGFHNLQTCFIPIPYYDVLEVIPSDEDSLTIYNHDFNEENILTKTRDALRQLKSFQPVDIYLYKNIPVGAGLGGGSSDAAFLLKSLNTMFELSLKEGEIMDMASQIGKDCPFFLVNKTMFASGTGDQFTDCSLNLKGFYVAVLTPPINISTKEAFSWINPRLPEISLSETLAGSNPTQWEGHVTNDFQDILEEKFPEIKEARHTLNKAGAIYAALSGTGSSVFGIFDHEPMTLSVPANWRSLISSL